MASRSHKQAAKLVISAREALALGGIDLLPFLDKREAAYRHLLMEDRQKDWPQGQEAIKLIGSMRAELFRRKPDWRRLFFELFALTGERTVRTQNPLQLQSHIGSVESAKAGKARHADILREFDVFKEKHCGCRDWKRHEELYPVFSKCLKEKGYKTGISERNLARVLKPILGPARPTVSARAARRP